VSDITKNSEINVTQLTHDIFAMTLLLQLVRQNVMTLDQADAVFTHAAARLLELAPKLSLSEEERDRLVQIAVDWQDFLRSTSE